MDASYIAEHNDISRMCLKLGHNFLRIQKDVKPYSKNRDKEKQKRYKNYENERNQNLKKTNQKKTNCDNNIEGETLKLIDDDTQQADCKLFQELNQQFQKDSFRETQKRSNEDENIQVFLEVQVKPEFQDNNGEEQIMPKRDLKLDLKILFESEEEEEEEEENTQLLFDKERQNVEKQTKVKNRSKNQLQEIGSEPKNKKRKLTKEQHRKNIENVDTLINEGNVKINGIKEQKSKKEVEEESIKPNEKLKKIIDKELKKSNIDIAKLGQGKFDLSVIQKVNEKNFNNYAISLERSIKPIEERVKSIAETYFPSECKLRLKCHHDVQTNTPKHKDVNNQTLSDETCVASQVVNNKTKYSLNGSEIKMFENDKKFEFPNEKSKNNQSESPLNFNQKVNKKVLGETKTHGIKEIKQDKSKEIVQTEESFDFVILYNSDKKNIEKITQPNVNVQQINFNEEIITKFEENSQQNNQKNLDCQIQVLDEGKKFEIEKNIKEDFCLQFRFFKEEENISPASSVGSSIFTTDETSSKLLKHKLHNEKLVKLNESSCVQEFSQKYSEHLEIEVETLSDAVDDSEIKDDFKVIKETSEEKIPVSLRDSSICTIEKNSNKLLKQEIDDEEKNIFCENDFPLQRLEDSDIDVETFSDTVEDTEQQIQNEAEVRMEMFEGETTLSSNASFDEEDYCNSFSKRVEINEVIEIVEEYEVVNGLKSVVDYQSPTDVKCSPTKLIKHKKIEKDSNVQDEYGKSLSTLETSELNKVENSNRIIKNVQQLDETLREKMREESHSQSNGSYALNENMELESNKEQKLTKNRAFIQSHKHKKKFENLKINFQSTRKNFNHINKLSKKIFKKYNEKKVIDLPKKFHDLKLVDNYLSKELKELNINFIELESELQHSVELEESNINPISKKKPYNIFKKLRAIHDKQLIKFSESNKWPQNCLYPSSTLDLLFEDPDEVKPNVLLFTLFPEDIGYSIKIVMKMNQPPIELFYTYSDDSILSYVEKEKLPIELLNLLDCAEPRLFYYGCVVAEIHDHRDGTPGRIYRILLRPCNESIRHDMNNIIEENSQIQWTYFKKLELERRMLLQSNPVICVDSLPIAGTAALMQHHFTSCRSICLNPLKNDFISPKSKSFNNDSFNECETSDLMDFIGDENSILQEFGFHLKSSKIDILTLIILANTDPFKLSLLLCSSVKVKPVTVMKVEALFGSEKLNELITVSLDILRQKISDDIEVIQTDKYDEYSFHTLKYSPPLPDDCIHETTHANIIKLIDKFMDNVCVNHLTIKNYLENVHESEIDPLNVKLVVNPETLSADTQNNGRTYLNLQTDNKKKKSIHFCSTKKMSKNSSKYLDLTNMKLGRDHIVESPPLKSETTLPLSVILYVESFSAENSSENTETKSDVDLSFTSLFLFKDSNKNLEQEYLCKLIPVPHLTYVMSSLPCYLTLVSSTTSTMSSFYEDPINDSDTDTPNNNTSFETSIIDSSIPNNLQFQTNGQTLTSINDNSTDTRLESVIVTPAENLEHSINIGDPTVYVIEDLPTTSYASSETEFSQVNEETIKQISKLKLN